MHEVHIRKYGLVLLSALCLIGVAACSKSADDATNRNSDIATDTVSSPPQASSDYSALAADAAQVEAGKNLFGNCAVCHSVNAATPSPAGPQLIAVVGRKIGGAEGFPYSQALKNADGSWTPEKLDEFLKDPMGTYPGTAMAFGGLAKEADRKAIIAYLASIK